MRLRVKGPVLGVIIIGCALGLYLAITGEVSWFEGQGVELKAWDASNRNADFSNPRSTSLSGAHVFIDPDGDVTYGTIGIKRGTITGLDVALTEPVPVNFQNNLYQQTSSTQWKPSESWEVDGQEISVYRSMFGITLTTAPSRPDRELLEVQAIQNFDLTLHIDLQEWPTEVPANAVIGAVMIPKESEMAALSQEAVVILVKGEQDQGFLDQLSLLGLTITKQPSMSPITPGTYLAGTPIQTDQNIMNNAPKSLDIHLTFGAIAPGVEQVNLLTSKRLEVDATFQLAMFIMSSRPLYQPSGQPGAEPSEQVEPAPVCGFFETPETDQYGRVTCVENTLFKFAVVAIVVVIAAVVLLGGMRMIIR